MKLEDIKMDNGNKITVAGLDNKYHEVWSNQFFSILLPGINSKP